MDIKAAINDKLQRLQDLNRQMKEITDQIGALQEKGRALHGMALEVKGAIDALAIVNAENEKATQSLILPDKTLVAADGTTPIAKAEEAPVETPAVA